MSNFSSAQYSFAGGEWGPFVFGRADLERYQIALRLCLNYIPTAHGPLVRRPGSNFIAPAGDSATAVRLHDFIYNEEQAYILEFRNNAVRFFTSGSQVLNAANTISGATAANPVVITATGHTLSNGDEVFISDVVGMTELNGRWFTVANAGANDFELSGIDGTGYTTYSSGGEAASVYEVTTTYTTAQLFDLKFVQSNDILWITHPSHAPATLSRTASTPTFALADVEFIDGPYIELNLTTTTLTPSAVTGSGVTLTASAVTGINDGDGFQTTDVGRIFRYRPSAPDSWGYGIITARSSTTVVTITWTLDPGGTAGASTEWYMGLYSDTTGWPSCATFYGNRLYYAGSTSNPNRMDGSVPGGYNDFRPDDQSSSSTVEADNGVAFTLTSRKANKVVWMAEDEKGLIAGTSGGTWLIRASNNDAISASNPPNPKKNQNFGSADLQAVEAGEGLLFLHRDWKEFREVAYVFEVDKLKSPEMTLLADQITDRGVTYTQLAFSISPHPIVWAVASDGQVASFTYERDQQVQAWARHVLGGESTSGGASAAVESVAVIPSDDGGEDEIWLSVKRYINGSTVRYIERLNSFWDAFQTAEDAIQMDCAFTYDGAAADMITGLWQWEGETLDVMVDGSAHDQVTVADGSVTLDVEGEKVHLGFLEDAALAPMSVEGGARKGTPVGEVGRIDKMKLRVLNSFGGLVGPAVPDANGRPGYTALDLDKVPLLNFADPDALLGDPPTMKFGWVELDYDGEYEEERVPIYVNDTVFPSIIQALRFEGQLYED